MSQLLQINSIRSYQNHFFYVFNRQYTNVCKVFNQSYICNAKISLLVKNLQMYCFAKNHEFCFLIKILNQKIILIWIEVQCASSNLGVKIQIVYYLFNKRYNFSLNNFLTNF